MIIKLLKNSFLMKNLRIIRNKTNLIIFIIDISRYLFVSKYVDKNDINNSCLVVAGGYDTFLKENI